MRVNEIRVNQIRVNQGLGVCSNQILRKQMDKAYVSMYVTDFGNPNWKQWLSLTKMSASWEYVTNLYNRMQK